MSSSKTKSAAVQKAAQAAQEAQARVNQAAKPKSGRGTLEDMPMYFLNLDPSVVSVEVDKKTKKLNIRFNTGARSSGNQPSNSTMPYLCQQLVAATSKCSGEGNVGTKHKGGEFYRTDATYGMTFRVGLTESGAGGEELLELQRASHKWVFDTACVIMAKVYDLKLEDWTGPVNAARNDACMALWRDIKDENGEPLGSDVDLQALIGSPTPAGKAAAKRVEAAARESFVKTAVKKGNIPCAPIVDEKDKKTILGHTDLYTHGRVYRFKTWSENHPHRKATGPLLSELQSTLENWAEIQRQMGDVDREYSYAYELYDEAGNEKNYQMIEVLMQTINPATGQRVMQTKRIRNPFSNPLLETKGGVPLDTLVLPQIVFSIKRGLTDTEYGIKVRYERKLRMTVQEKRPAEMPTIKLSYGTGFVEDDEEEEAPQKPAAAAAVPASPIEADKVAESEDGEVAVAEVPASQPFGAMADEDDQPVDDEAEKTEDADEASLFNDADEEPDFDRLAAEEVERLTAPVTATKTNIAPKRKGPPAAAEEKRARK